MNDFSRDELNLIYDGLCYAAGCSKETGSTIADILYPIAKKIETMINNYCEHEWRLCDIKHRPDECIKCKALKC